MKFGGSSVADAAAMLKVFEIVNKFADNELVVVLSACKGMTDKLIACANYASNNNFSESIHLAESIEIHHFNILNEVINNDKLKKNALDDVKILTDELKTFLEGVSLLQELTPKSLDQILSFGERLSTLVFSHICKFFCLNCKWMFAPDFIKTDSNFNSAKYNISNTKNAANDKLIPVLKQEKLIITQGFIGSDDDSIVTTLGRGGSDLSAAIIGAAINADEIWIWTDVSGVLSADPRKLNNTKTIRKMTFNEVRELAFFGAKVLHPDTIKPAMEDKIPVRVLNTFEPDNKGTLILENIIKNNAELHSVISMNSCVFLSINKPAEADFSSFANNTFNILELNNFKILYTLITESNIRCVLKPENQSLDILFATEFNNYNIKWNECAVLCLSGIGIDQFKLKSQKIISKLQNGSDYYQLIAGFSENAIVMICKPEDEMKVLEQIHELILNSIEG